MYNVEIARRPDEAASQVENSFADSPLFASSLEREDPSRSGFRSTSRSVETPCQNSSYYETKFHLADQKVDKSAV